MGLSQAFLPSQPVAKQGMRFPPGLLATEPCLLFPTPVLILNPQSQMSHSPSPSRGTGPHQAPQTIGLGTALSQWQGDIPPKGSSSVLCLPGAKKPGRGTAQRAPGLRGCRGWSAGERGKHGVGPPGRRAGHLLTRSSCFCRAPRARHALGKELHESLLKHPARWPCDTEASIPISQTRLVLT